MDYSDLHRLLNRELLDLYPEREIGSIGRLVTEHVTGMSAVQLQVNQHRSYTSAEESQILSVIKRLKAHEPIQYILGETEFYGLRLKVRPGVLIPRGETEELVEWILTVLTDKEKGKRKKEKGWRILDIGCGSGAIAIALAKKLPDAEIIAADISEESLALARENAELNQVSIAILYFNILIQEPSLAGSMSPFDVIVSNPPYIPTRERPGMERHVVDFEPATALFVPDEDPLVFYRAIASFAQSNLVTGGELFVEIHDRLGRETETLFRNYFDQVEMRKDIHGKDRMIRACHG